MKKRSIFNRVLSVFLAVLMLTGSVPGSFMFSEAAEAEETVTAGETFYVGSVVELNSAITAANAAGSNVVTTIKLSNTITLNESADSFTEIDSGNILFDFNGNSLGISYCLSGEYEESQTQVQLPALNQAQMHNDKDVFSNGMFIIRAGASMQIINSSGDKASVLSVYTDLEDNSKKGDVEHQTSSSLIYNEGTLIIGDKDNASNNNFELYAHSSCRNVNGDNYLLYGKKSASVNCYAVTVNSDSAIFKMYGGKISATGVTRARRAAYADISCYALNVNNCYSAEVYGGEINIPKCPVDNDNGISQVTTTASAESSAAVSAIRSATSYLYIFDSNVFVQTQAGADTSNSNSLYTSCIYSVSDESAPHIYGGTFSYLVYRASGNSSAENNSYVVRGAYKCAENGNLNPDTISGYDYGFSSAAAGEYKEEAFSIHTVFIGDDKTAENGIDMFSYDTFRDYLADYSEKTDAYYGNSFVSKNPDVSNFAEIAGYKREGFTHQAWKGKQSPGEEYTEDYLSRIELNESFSGSLFLAPVWVDKSLFPDCSAGNHSFSAEDEIWKYLTDNYCTEDGLKEAVCEKCGIRVLEKFVATGHSFDEESSTVVEPTCTESGLVSKKCTACEFLEETQTPATGHTDSNSDIFCDVCGIYTDELLDSGTSEDITWEFFSNGTLVLSGNGRMKDNYVWLFVPWKDYFADIKKVIIGDGVENICKYAFNRCDNLKEVIIGSGLSEEMSNHVFPQSAQAVFEKITVSDTNDNFVSVDGVLYTKDMSELICYPCAKEGSSFTVPSSVSTLHAFAFNYADELTEITIEENSSLTEIESSVFAECNMLEEIYLPASVSLIGSSFPGSCDSLKAINVSEDNLYYASIDGVLFNKDKTTLIKYPANKSDSSYAVPDSVTKIETSAFYECKNLTDVVVPSSVTSIGSNAFKLCDNLQSISLPFAGSSPESTGATAVFGYIFGYSTSSEATVEGTTQQYSTENSSGSITYYHYNIPEKLTKVTITGAYPIASGAFYNCTGLKNVIIDKNVPSVGNGAFRNCSALESITIPFVGASASATAHEAVFGYVFGYMTSENYSEEGLTQQFYADSLYYHYYIPEALIDVSIDGVSSIPEKAFYGCNRIKSVTLSESIKNIAGNAFFCSSLEKVNFTGTVSQWCNINFADAIANPLFYGNNFYINDVLVTELDIPDDITEIKNYAFTSAYCIEKLNFSDSVTTVGTNAFANCKGLTELEISDGITSLGANAFNGCHSITEITIGKGLSSIGDCALQRTGGELSSITVDEDNKSFSSLYGVLFNKDKTELILYPCAKAGTSYTVPDSVRKLGKSSFCNNENLLSIKLPDGLLEICDEAFDYSRMLKSIEIPASVDSIGEFAFANCLELTTIALPDSMSYIGDCAFRYCDKLQEVVLPEGIEEIGQNMFGGCDSLTSVTIPSTVSYFDRDCFKNCKNLTDVYFNGTVQDWCNIEFHVFFIISPSATHPLYYADNFYIGGEKVIDLIIPEGVTSINKYVFRYYEALESVHIPKSVTKIGASAFYGCSNLSSVVIENGSGLNVINSSAFSGCSSLKEADFKDCIELTTLGASAFSGCTSLERVNLHSSVETIGNNVFSNHSENLVIGCYENSAVHTYAVENSIPVEFMEHTYISEHFDATTSQEGYTVYTCTHCGDSYTVPDPAGPVENLYVIGETYKISLSWSKAAEASVTGYHVFRKGPDDADYVLVNTINDRNTVSYVDTDVVAESEYFYKVRALKGDIEGEFCEPVSAIALTDTEAPRIIKLEPAASLNSVINKTVSFALKAEDNIGVVKYELYVSPVGKEEWLLIGEKKGSSASISFDTTTCVDGEYSFRAVAFDNAGNSGDGDIIKAFRIDNTGPEKVTGLKAIEVYASKATLAWNSVADSDANHFILRRKSGDGYVIVSSSISGSLGYYLNNLLPATEYTYSVACVDHYGNVGEYSDDFTLKTADDTTAPVITALAPSAGRYNNSINFRITASDDCAIQSITVQISSDGKDWKDINTVTYSDYSATKSYSYTVSLSNFTDGAVYIRGITTDKSGNISDTSEKAPLIQYYVDKTAPAAPSGVTAAGGDGYIQIRWNKSDETDISGYYVYRSTSENGTYSKITGKLSTLNHYDRNVERGKTYYYKVVAADTTGNISVASSYVLSMSLDDTIAPSIGSISPSSKTAISKNNNKIGVLASDNNMLSSITVEYKTAGGDYKILSVFDNIGEYHKVVYTNLPMAEFSDGDTVTVRAFCRDVAGFESVYSAETTYIIDMSAPGLSQLSAVHENGICTLTWNDLSEADLSGYKVYRSVNGGSYSYLGSRSVDSSHSYTFKDSVGVGEYVYRIDCVDKSGNLKSYYSQKIILEKPAQITPVIDSVSYMEIGVQEIFSAASSKADNTIVSYSWDFGDGTTSDKTRVTKVYSQEGEYTVSLRITDSEGNTAVVSKNITVAKRELLGTAKVRVVNENGKAISSAPVYFDLGEENQQIVYTNSSGYASITMKTGVHIVGTYKNGYLPVSNKLTVLANSTAEITLTMVEQNIITGEFEVHEMTFEEIVASGIDIKDPANQQIYEVSVTLIYGEEKIPVRYVRNDTEIISYTIGNSGGNSSGGSSGGNYSPIRNVSYVPNKMNQEIIAVVEVPVTASYLKQFYSANLHIVNNAAAGFEIVNCEASISAPDGLTVVQHTPISSVIDGQSSSTASWILRGDKAGTYSLSASFDGMLADFNVPVNGTFTADEPVVVYGPESVKLRIEVQDEISEHMLFNVCLVNNRDVNLNYPNINVTDFVYNITEAYKKEYSNTGDYAEDEIKEIRSRFLRLGVISADGKATFYDVSDPYHSPVKVLGPGEILVYEYSVNNVTDYTGTAFFNRAIINCDDYYASSIEVVTMSEMPTYITQDQFVKEHRDFVNSFAWAAADTTFPERISEGIKDSFEEDWYEFVEFDYFTNYADVVLADFILQQGTYSEMENKFFKACYDSVKTGYEKVSEMIWTDIWDLTVVKEGDLSESKIYKIFTGELYNSKEYKTLDAAINIAAGKHQVPEEYIKNIFNVGFGVDVAIAVSDFVGDSIEIIRNATNYTGALNAYSYCMNDQFKEIFESSIEHLGEDEKKMREAMEEFISYDNSSEFEKRIREDLVAKKSGVILSANLLYSVFSLTFKEMYVGKVKIFASTALHKLFSSLSASADFNLAGIGIGFQLGIAVSKVLANTGNLNLAMSQLEYYTQLAGALEKEMRSRERTFISDETYENAQYFCTAYNAFKNAWLASAELFATYVTQKNNSLAVKIFSRDKFKDDIADAVSRVSGIKKLNCHYASHYVYAEGSKTAMVECPVDVCIYNKNGDLLAKVTDSETVINDSKVFALSYDSKKFVSMPSSEDYVIRIEATDSGEMDYTVLEYDVDDVNIRRVVFENISLEKNDVFEGEIDSVIFTDKDNYRLTKNSDSEVIPSREIVHEVTGIELCEKSCELNIGEQFALSAVVVPQDVVDASVSWECYDNSIATVDENGIVTAKIPGETIIKVITKDGGYVDYCKITVSCNEHSFNEWEIVTEPGCLEEGTRKHTCGLCGYDEEDIIAATGHSYSYVVTFPSCTEKGYTTYTCSVCEDTYVADEVAATGHKEQVITGKVPTCTADGLSDGIVCSVCGEVVSEQKYISATGHKYDRIDYVPDCVEEGFSEYICSVCSDSYRDNYVAATGHTDADSDGYCDVCSEKTGSAGDNTGNCSHLCHKTGFLGFIWKVINFFNKLFKINQICSCGGYHW